MKSMSLEILVVSGTDLALDRVTQLRILLHVEMKKGNWFLFEFLQELWGAPGSGTFWERNGLYHWEHCTLRDECCDHSHTRGQPEEGKRTRVCKSHLTCNDAKVCQGARDLCFRFCGNLVIRWTRLAARCSGVSLLQTRSKDVEEFIRETISHSGIRREHTGRFVHWDDVDVS